MDKVAQAEGVGWGGEVDREDAQSRARLDQFAGRSFVGLVVDAHFAAKLSVTSEYLFFVEIVIKISYFFYDFEHIWISVFFFIPDRFPKHDQFGKTIAGHR